MPNAKWSKKDIPSQSGKVILITGATSGLGYETALALTEVGATVIIAGRNEERGKESLEILSLVPNAKISFEKLDLASLVSIAEFCKRFLSTNEKLDTLINNAGVIGKMEKREVTEDGFELSFGTNHLGHFALTAQLLPLLRRAPEPRVVNISSSAHLFTKINFDDLQSESKYDNMEAYGQSKICNILFTMELQRKSDAEGWGLTCVSAHPGFSKTDLVANTENARLSFKLWKAIIFPVFRSSPAEGALTFLYAATSPDAKASVYYGPNGLGEMAMSFFGGPPVSATMNPDAENLDFAKKLWEVSCSLSNVTWN